MNTKYLCACLKRYHANMCLKQGYFVSRMFNGCSANLGHRFLVEMILSTTKIAERLISQLVCVSVMSVFHRDG